tara:strand:+ start:384 stop:842 length:459 start_codon:yes stop_codon:yes gene_type:complete
MATPTFDLLAQSTASSQTSMTISSIPSGYETIYWVWTGYAINQQRYGFRINGNTSTYPVQIAGKNFQSANGVTYNSTVTWQNQQEDGSYTEGYIHGSDTTTVKNVLMRWGSNSDRNFMSVTSVDVSTVSSLTVLSLDGSTVSGLLRIYGLVG